MSGTYKRIAKDLNITPYQAQQLLKSFEYDGLTPQDSPRELFGKDRDTVVAHTQTILSKALDLRITPPALQQSEAIQELSHANTATKLEEEHTLVPNPVPENVIDLQKKLNSELTAQQQQQTDDALLQTTNTPEPQPGQNTRRYQKDEFGNTVYPKDRGEIIAQEVQVVDPNTDPEYQSDIQSEDGMRAPTMDSSDAKNDAANLSRKVRQGNIPEGTSYLGDTSNSNNSIGAIEFGGANTGRDADILAPGIERDDRKDDQAMIEGNKQQFANKAKTNLEIDKGEEAIIREENEEAAEANQSTAPTPFKTSPSP